MDGYRQKSENLAGKGRGQPRRPTLMQLQVSLPLKMTLTAGIMLALIGLVYLCAVPNPNMILIAGLVLCSALFGFAGGLVGAVIMLGYTLFFFSTGHSFTHFSHENLLKVAVSLCGITADVLLVCLLKRAEVLAFREAEELRERLREENELLQSLSRTDALTGIRNRMALQQELGSYVGREITVMMLDINDFKRINDSCGHEEGDRVLRETGRLLAAVFGEPCCYRYGGDEFLVVCPEEPEAAFQARLERVLAQRPSVSLDGESAGVCFAVGSARALVKDEETVTELISLADERMYEQKRDMQRAGSGAGQPARPEETAPGTEAYTPREMTALLEQASGQYDLARVVDPIECRVLRIREDGTVSRDERCYGIWNAGQKCLNCSSAVACRTGRRQEKAERFQDKLFRIQSKPVTLKLPDGGAYEAVMELVSVERQAAAQPIANDRAAENVGSRARHYQALHDSLTDVLNAGAFYELARETVEKRAGQPWVMVTANIMNFRLVNTLFGVTRGNEVLVRTAELLRALSSEAGGLCGRLGGDQFALLLPAERYEEARLLDISGRLMRAFNSGLYTLCIHFGVYRVEDAALPVSVMCGRANSALRTIREDLTRTVAYFDDEIRRKTLQEQKIISGFEAALREGQFRMYLQPLVDEEGCVLGAEALARWRQPDGTLILPGDFIETLEQAGLIQKLDVYIWERAVQQLSAWKGTEKEALTISVNMSAKDVYSIDVFEVLSGLTRRYGVDSRLLRVEITETALLVEPDKSDAVVSRLREHGFIVEIDDFGKGYSSLSLLKNIRADVLKIDMGFLREIRDRERSRVILSSVIELARSLGMEVITEGVETQQQLSALRAMGCTRFQGYYFSRPIPAEEFEKSLAAAV